MSINQIIISGTVQAKNGLELKSSDSGAKYLFLNLMSFKPGTEKKQFVRVACWGAVAEKAAKDLANGTEVLISGKFTNDARKKEDETWEDNWTVHAADVTVLGAGASVPASAPAPVPAAAAPAPAPAAAAPDLSDDF